MAKKLPRWAKLYNDLIQKETGTEMDSLVRDLHQESNASAGHYELSARLARMIEVLRLAHPDYSRRQIRKELLSHGVEEALLGKADGGKINGLLQGLQALGRLPDRPPARLSESDTHAGVEAEARGKNGSLGPTDRSDRPVQKNPNVAPTPRNREQLPDLQDADFADIPEELHAQLKDAWKTLGDAYSARRHSLVAAAGWGVPIKEALSKIDVTLDSTPELTSPDVNLAVDRVLDDRPPERDLRRAVVLIVCVEAALRQRFSLRFSDAVQMLLQGRPLLRPLVSKLHRRPSARFSAGRWLSVFIEDCGYARRPELVADAIRDLGISDVREWMMGKGFKDLLLVESSSDDERREWEWTRRRALANYMVALAAQNPDDQALRHKGRAEWEMLVVETEDPSRKGTRWMDLALSATTREEREKAMSELRRDDIRPTPFVERVTNALKQYPDVLGWNAILEKIEQQAAQLAPPHLVQMPVARAAAGTTDRDFWSWMPTPRRTTPPVLETPAEIKHKIPEIPAEDLAGHTAVEVAYLERARLGLAWAHRDRRNPINARERTEPASWIADAIADALPLPEGKVLPRDFGERHVDRVETLIRGLLERPQLVPGSDLRLALLVTSAVEIGLVRRYQGRADLESALLWSVADWAERLERSEKRWARWARARWVEVLIAACSRARRISQLEERLDIGNELDRLAVGLGAIESREQSETRSAQARAAFLSGRGRGGDVDKAREMLRSMVDSSPPDQRANQLVALAMIARDRDERDAALSQLGEARLDEFHARLVRHMRADPILLGWDAIHAAVESEARGNG